MIILREGHGLKLCRWGADSSFFPSSLTIKTNKSHNHAIFRIENSRDYTRRRWETMPEIDKRMRHDALMRLKRQYEATRKDG